MGCIRALCISALFVICHLFCSFHALDTITGTQFIADGENGGLVSSDGNFKLGFFSPGKSQARYVGIWFNKISEQTVVWVANRGTPIMNSAGVFKIGGDGNLAVFCCNQSSPLWSTNVSLPAGSSSTVKLLDSGNLVLVAKETIVWQSFDYPTDTVLPGIKFGWNRKTGLNHILTSWKSIDDPAPGEFSAGFDPHSIPQFFLYKNSVPHWRSGPWNGRILNGLPEVGGHKDYYSDQIDLINITFVSNDNEIYLKFSPKKGAVFSIVVLETMGLLKRLIWHESQKWVKVQVVLQDLCDEYTRCGANAICNEDTLAHCACLPGFERLYPQDWYLKCEETRNKGCGKGDGEGFVRLEGVKFPDARNSTVYSNMSLEECQRECSKSCNCTGYANLYVDDMGRGCIAWYGELRDMRRYKSGQDFYLRVDAVELAKASYKFSICLKFLEPKRNFKFAAADAQKNAKRILATKSTLVFIIVPVGVEILLAALCFYYLWRRRAKRKGDSNGYMSPEYAFDGLFSIKSDVFSFGVIVLEIVSGKKNRGFFHDDPYSNLIQYTWELWRDGKTMEIVDSCLADSFPSNEVLRCIQVGLLCVQDNAKDRPSMSTVVFMLSNETILPSPKKSTFAIRKNEPDSSSVGSNGGNGPDRSVEVQLQTYIADMHFVSEFSQLKEIGNLIVRMVETKKNKVYPLVYLLLTLVLILPVATATVERAFSAMNILKTHLLLVFHHVQFSTFIDTITANNLIRDGDVIVSGEKVFALGFFSPGKSLKRYVGIWFYQIPEQTVVWVANRDDPINGTSGVLSINSHGNLVLYETRETSTASVWSTNVSVISVNGTVAQLLDSGNLVLVENGTKKILWQSFDHPTDTILPLLKQGLDRRTGLDWVITSWKSPDDPGSGDYSQKIDPTGFPQLSLYKGSDKWWRTGTWTGKRWSGVPEMTTDPISNYNFVNNQDEVSLVFSLNDSSVLTRMIVNASGLVQRFTWKNQQKIWTWSAPNSLPCDYYGHCGPNSNCDPNSLDKFECTCLPGFEPKYPQEWNLRNGRGGCTRKRGMSTCQRREWFEKVARVKVPDTSVTCEHEFGVGSV
ncbi:hypothetical protein JRO89_XS06G0096200 [Xanthoceras sorbifolium]|uniref:non-specific serine/threonine protein kinase n=1 Tax=Xanthoceras sorbifolium TaxID=99658 RepID=A0ABQ8HXI1_9ROSI|nr:hypothetical protein JRO89_XS06G0096200 [Xanthoceras sorbifolium]